VHYALIAESKPLSYEEAVSDERWWKAMKEEIEAIEKNHTWKLTKLPSGKRPIALKWVYKSKVNSQESLQGTRPGLWPKDFYSKLELIMVKCLHQWLGLRLSD